jgi:predicted fused transcriptional regulator/phosphomethylpyrimidine kinase/predicted transcriptional regulator
MRFVEEVVVDEFLPTYRSLLAEALRERELTQHEVADLLGISQSAVSKYVHGDVARNETLLTDRRVTDLVEELADGLAAGEITPVQALIETEVLIRELERGGTLAELHEAAVPELSEYDTEFAIHDPDSRARAAERTLASVRRGISLLENASGFTAHIPAVGSNLVECLPDAEGIDDVAAVPGRIVDVKGRATVPADPEFGVSQFVATVLLAARRQGSDARATLNIAYDEATIEALRARDHVAVTFDPTAASEEEDGLDRAIGAALAEEPAADVLYHEGAFGIEPNVYVLGPDAATVAERVRAIL